MTSDPKTLSVYDDQAQEYAQLTQAEQASKIMITFAQDIPKGGRILDYGCGPGYAAAYFASLGYHVDAFDGSSEMVALAAQNPDVNARQMFFEDFASDQIYDGIWASFSLLHAPRDDFPNLLATIKAALRAQGRFLLSMKLGNGSHRDSLGRLYTYYSEQDLRDHLDQSGFTWDHHIHGSGLGLDGSHSDWIHIHAHA